MGFFMDGLDEEAYDRKYSDGELVRRIIGYFSPHLNKMLIVVLAIVATSIANTALPVYISRQLDTLRTAPESFNIQAVAVIAAILASAGWFFNLIRQTLSSQAVGDVVLKLREDAFDAVLKRDLSFYDQFVSGKIVSRVTSDTQAFSNVVTLTIDFMSQLLLIVVLIGYLFSVNVLLTLVTLALSPFIIGAALGFRVIARRTVRQSRRASAEVSNHVQETIAGISVAKTFRQEAAIYDEFTDVNKRSFRINLRTGYVFSAIFPILNILAGIGTGALVYFGGMRSMNDLLSPGEWYLFVQGIGLFWFPLTSIASFWSQFQLGLAASERVFALLDADAKVIQTGDEILTEVRGDIEFRKLQFAYKENEPVLQNFSLHIKAGETLALVGHTGSGKSSIGKLISRFYEFQGGSILIDGRDIRSFNLSSYRSFLGVVTQSPFLFDGTVMENIRYGSQDATDKQVEQIVERVGGGDWLVSLPNGLNTEVGERGGNLSMGQRQLVALSRVMLQNPSICILDEATASIDPLTETLIQEGVDAVLEGRTSIVIAHRLSTVRSADRIIVLKQGAIIEEGNHEELLASGGHYAELYNTYFRHQSIQYIEESGRELAGAK